MSELTFHRYPGGQVSPWWPQASQLRWDVFVQEQQVAPVLELDARDYRPTTTHLVGVDRDGVVQAAARILPDGNGVFHLGRVVVRQTGRGRGWGRQIMEAAHREVVHLLPPGTTGRLVLEAQVQAIDFYRSCGYQPTDDPRFLDAGIWHQRMDRSIVSSTPPAR
ncbi:GNAT family N-acetyltransferase [Scrofimicrobium sp. R131]|uniref:GNAT family N-acetyltransferase n=1 Tax=Scrofimicrobium appendicitidis TaxID=3079930 RepID=A0AAU7V6R5_9ACTO